MLCPKQEAMKHISKVQMKCIIFISLKDMYLEILRQAED